MILVISYCHKDLAQALRLLKWIGFLSEKNGKTMAKESVLLVPSRHCTQRITHGEIVSLARKIFGKVYVFTPEKDHEVGHPGACNWMFARTLEHVERHFQDDILWHEPDAIPIYQFWYEELKQEFYRHAKPFLGNFCDFQPYPHMTGNGVYGAQWRKYAPKLVTAPDHISWDCWAGKQVIDHAHLCLLIQHEVTPFTSRGNVHPKAVVYHPDKLGRLIQILDEEQFGWECASHPVFGYTMEDKENIFMTKFYHTENANRRIKSQGIEFQFEMYDNFGGAWRGLYATEVESEIVALDALTRDPRSAVKEITQAEYEIKAKKKWITKHSNSSAPWQVPQAAIHQGPAAVVVENPSPSPSEPPNLDDQPVVSDINDVLVIDTVEPSEPVAAPKPAPTPGAKKAKAKRKGVASAA